MLKLGIWQKRWFGASPPAGLFARLYYVLSKSRVSFRLLDLPANASKEDAEIFERLMPFICLSGGTYRTTFRGRFSNLDPVVNAVLAKNFSATAELHVEDWAASACLTSSEWATTLFPLFPRLRFVASDFLLFLVELERLSSRESFVCEPDGHPLQYIRPPFVIRLSPPEPWLLALNWVLYIYGQRRCRRVWESIALPDSWMDPMRQETLEQNDYRVRKLSLIHPEALRLVHNDPRFTIRRQSVFERLPSPSHVIRSMNVLNRAYFSEERLAEGVRSAIDSLRTGGIWIVGRTMSENPPVHNLTIFRKQDSGELEIIERHGAGSEIESLATAASR